MSSGGVNLLSNIVSFIAHRLLKGALSDAMLSDLKRMVSSISATNLNFNPEEVNRYVDEQNRRNRQPSAPTIYIPVYECAAVSVGIFYLRFSHSKIPLHDHPGITGLIKALHGAVHVTQINAKVDQRRDDTLIPVDEIQSIVLRHDVDNVGQVFPKKFNFHEISVANLPEEISHGAAFLDVLFPPYDPAGRRNCSYFEVCEGSRTDGPVQRFLRQLPDPPSEDVFSTDIGPYFGPPVQLL